MAITQVARLGWSLAGLAAAASVWVACVSTAGSRLDFLSADGGTVPTGDGGTVTSSSSSSGGMPGASSSSGGAQLTPDQCGFPDSGAPNPTLYSGAPSGAAQVCVTSILPPRSTNWFSYHDATNDGGLLMTAGAGTGGCGGTSTCAYHAYGPSNDDAGAGFNIYGAGVGFDLTDVNSVAQNYDASMYTGIQFWAKGTTLGTRGPNYANSPQTIHLKLVTATNRSGDDYGFYCTMLDPNDWTLCRSDFSVVKRDGFSSTPPVATDMFDPMVLQKVQFELSLYSAPAGTMPIPSVMFDIWIDEVSFY
ncbi:MAG TPA: hypothetical protein VGM06_06955 [Polyangiaceae bacterium]|jgi:hypothetical protein